MNCKQCGFEFEEGAVVCPQCGAEQGQIQVLTPEERENFQGLTIEDEPRRENYYEYHSEGPHHKVYVRRVELGNTPGGILLKLMIGVILVALVIIALPVALFGMGALMVGWLLARFRRR